MNGIVTASVCCLCVLTSCDLLKPTGPDPVEPDPNSLSTSSQSWYQASPPVRPDSLWFHPPAWEYCWFTPRDIDDVNRIRRDDIVVLSQADENANLQSSVYVPVLLLHAVPAPEADSLQYRYRKAWAGIMTPISPDLADKESSQFFEFFVKVDGGFGSKGTLRIQMGKMREDLSLNGGPPNSHADSEDSLRIPRKGTYDPHLDIGFDRLRDSTEVYLVPSSRPEEWDTVRYGDKLLGADSLDPAKDNYRQYRFESGDPKSYRYDCRRSGDALLSSEDINGDGSVQAAITEQYFQFDIDLNDAQSPLIDTTVNYAHPGEWRKYRIPLHEPIEGYEGYLSKVGEPDWSKITTIRLIWTDFDPLNLTKEQKMSLYDLRFD